MKSIHNTNLNSFNHLKVKTKKIYGVCYKNRSSINYQENARTNPHIIIYKLRCRIEYCGCYVSSMYKNKLELQREKHEDRHSLEEKFQCFYCKKTFDVLSKYKKHLPKCGKKFDKPIHIDDCEVIDGQVTCMV